VPAEVKEQIRLEVAHVLFIDIVGYSKLSINEQRAVVDELTTIVRGSDQYQKAEAAGRLIKIPTGDGMALVFYTSQEAPAQCAVEISGALKAHPRLQVRMGVHSGPVSGVIDVNGHANLAGAGLNVAQRVMACGDAGHILVSKHVAEDLEEYEHWRPLLHDLGICEVKHGARLGVVNLYADHVGNSQLPKKFQALKKRNARVRWAAMTAALLALAAIIAGIAMFSRYRARSSLAAPEKTIAVLPFENLSADPENAFFTDGVQDEVLNDLAKIADLKVISRTSAMQYKRGVKRNLREVANELGVAHVVEGSVQRAANRVRVTAQLIDARNDTHVWAEKYDRDLADVFAIQSEIAQKIANQLQAKLSPAERSQMARKPTENGEAYLAFVQAHNLFSVPAELKELKQSEQLYARAIKLDPNFALAFAGLSMVDSVLYHNWDPVPARREKARLNADEALRLQRDLPEGHLALGYSYYYGDRDYERALAEFEIARRGLPNESEAYLAIGAIQRRQGKWTESTANLEKSAALDPKNAIILTNLAFSYVALRNFEAADKTLDRVIASAPQSSPAILLKGHLAIVWKGDLTEAEKQFSSIPSEIDPNGLTTGNWVWLLTLQRKFPEALAVLQKFRGETLANNYTFFCPKAFLEGSIYMLQGDEAKARTELEHARMVSQQLLREAPDEPDRHAQHGMVLATLGQKEEAINEGKRAVELLPESQDAFGGPQVTAALAQIYAQTGEFDEAFRLLDHLLTIPSGLTVPILKLDPAWDPLRNDPRFLKLASTAPDTADK
jgi:TolB-like protein/Flp pilus assembly protein TadD/class 3 adenylate cyclase